MADIVVVPVRMDGTLRCPACGRGTLHQWVCSVCQWTLERATRFCCVPEEALRLPEDEL